AVAAARRKRWLWPAATGLAAAAALATLAAMSGFALGGLTVSADRWLLFAVEATLVATGLALLSRPGARFLAVAGLAAFAVLQALSELAVFRHAVVVSALPAAAVRLAAALALGSGLAAAGLVFLVPTPAARRPQTRRGPRYVRNSRKEQA